MIDPTQQNSLTTSKPPGYWGMPSFNHPLRLLPPSHQVYFELLL